MTRNVTRAYSNFEAHEDRALSAKSTVKAALKMLGDDADSDVIDALLNVHSLALVFSYSVGGAAR